MERIPILLTVPYVWILTLSTMAYIEGSSSHSPVFYLVAEKQQVSEML